MTADDERAIIAVLLRYATGIDTRDWALFRTCFTDDCEGIYGSFGHWKSGDEITSVMDEMHRALGPTLHRMTNFVVTGDADTATARCYVDALLLPAEADGELHRGIGYYDDQLVKRGGEWRIAKRHFVAVQII
jgi:3-phenylpropionate/cinnamic acid dioxygenase small subunit